MTWTHCEVYWDLDFEPSETTGGQPVALEASVFVWNCIGLPETFLLRVTVSYF